MSEIKRAGLALIEFRDLMVEHLDCGSDCRSAYIEMLKAMMFADIVEILLPDAQAARVWEKVEEAYALLGDDLVTAARTTRRTVRPAHKH